jgi:hypothetical protein
MAPNPGDRCSSRRTPRTAPPRGFLLGRFPPRASHPRGARRVSVAPEALTLSDGLDRTHTSIEGWATGELRVARPGPGNGTRFSALPSAVAAVTVTFEGSRCERCSVSCVGGAFSCDPPGPRGAARTAGCGGAGREPDARFQRSQRGSSGFPGRRLVGVCRCLSTYRCRSPTTSAPADVAQKLMR